MFPFHHNFSSRFSIFTRRENELINAIEFNVDNNNHQCHDEIKTLVYSHLDYYFCLLSLSLYFFLTGKKFGITDFVNPKNTGGKPVSEVIPLNLSALYFNEFTLEITMLMKF